MGQRLLWTVWCFSIAFVLPATSGRLSADETAGEKAISITGAPVPGTAALDEMMTGLLRKWKIPGGALAVAKDGRLLFAHGYGWADREAGKPVQPDSLFRIASISKPITAAAILVLAERGRLNLDAKVLDVLKPQVVPSSKPRDKRWKQITIRQLLFHTAGFDRDTTFDPMFRSDEIAKETGTPAPAEPTAIIRYMMDRRLDFDPGTKHVYSNFGYCLLGRVIEQVTGKKYGEAVQELVLRPAGITRMEIGRTRLAGRLPGEVRYYTPDDEKCQSVFPDDRGPVVWPYGGFYLEAMDAHGAWVASTIDLLRFASAVDGSRKPCLLKPETVRLIESRPPAPLPANATSYYGLGWSIRPVGKSANWSHNGSLPGTMSLLVRGHHGLSWAVVFNLRPADDGRFLGEMDRGVWKATGLVKKWPEGDLFRHD